VTSITGLGLLIDHRTNLGTVRRDRNLTLFVENSDLGNSLSLGHIIDDPLVFVPSILDHCIADAQTDGLAEVEGLLFCFIENLTRERPDVEVEEDSFDHDYHNDDTQKDLCLQTAKPHFIALWNYILPLGGIKSKRILDLRLEI
jgi:hypothetical protein